MQNFLTALHSSVRRWVLVAPAAFVFLLSGCGGGGSSNSNNVTPTPTTPTPAAKSELFGLHIQALATPVPPSGYGEVRIWSNVNSARWSDINTGPGTYDFSVLDQFLAEFYSSGITDVVYTIGEVPQWASSNPSDTSCDFAILPGTWGGCDLPTDINLDGTGSDQTFVAFVTALAQHVNDPTYLQSHAHIKYWEPWNEWYRNTLVSTYTWSQYSINASYAQMVRMTQDVRCVIAGKGSINGVPCTPIDSTALIVSPSSGANSCCFAPQVFQNFLYCNNNPDAGGALPNSDCTTGSAGSAAVDVINTHWYEGSQPENLLTDVPAFTTLLSSTDTAKPLWSDEGGWGTDSLVPDPDMEAAFVARYYFSGWTAGVQRLYWYAYDSPIYGTLFSSGLTPAGEAYASTSSWVAGSTLSSKCAPSGTVWTCKLTLANGSAAEVIWDTSQTCASGVCTTGTQSVASTWGNYQDLTGANHPIATAGSVPVGVKPILLTTSSSAAPTQ